MEWSEMVVVAEQPRLDEARQVFGSSQLSVQAWPASMTEEEQLLAKLYADGRRGFVIYGGDDLVGRVVTAYWRRSELGVHPLNLWPLDVGEAYVACQGGKSMTPKQAVRAGEKAGGDSSNWVRHRVGTLKVTSSTEKAAWYGFTFGAGWVYRVMETRTRARGGGAGQFVTAFGRLATETLREDDGGPIALRVAIDHEPTDDEGGSMMASTLERTYFGYGVDGGGAGLWDQLPASVLMRRAMTPELLDAASQGGRAFESVHLDTPGGWLLDGRLHGGDESGVVQVVPGPTVTVVRPRTGLRAVAHRLLSRRR